MGALNVTIGADITALRRGFAGASDLVAASARRMGTISASGLAGIGRGGAVALQKGFAVAGTALKAAIGGALAGGAAAGIAVKGVMAAADFEQTKAAFRTLIGDAAKAEETLAQLRQLGAETPFEFPELADAGRKLIAFGEGADTVAATLRRIGDISAGVQAPINEIAELYGKARVQGHLFGEDINQLTNRGIPIIQELAKQFGVSDSQVKQLVADGKVGFPQVEQAFISLTSEGGKFAGMMDAQSKTTSGLFSTLKDGFNEVLLALGTPINDALRPLVAEAIGMVSKLAPLAQKAGEAVRDTLNVVVAAFRGGQLPDLVVASLKLAFAEGANSLVAGIKVAVEFFWTLLTDGAMWASFADIALGTVAKIGGALMTAFETPLVYLQSSIEWLIAKLLKGVAMVPGMGTLMGFEARDVEDDPLKILSANRENGPGLFGINSRDMGSLGTDAIKPAAVTLGERVAAAGQAASAAGGRPMIDTTGLREDFDRVVGSIRDSMPEPDEAQAAAANAAPTTQAEGIEKTAAERLEPITTSLGKVGGGDYGTGMLDAQRENNKLTSRTNELLKESNELLQRLGDSTGPSGAVFG